MGIKLHFICIGFAFAFCKAVVKGMEKETCFLYPIDETTASSTLDIRKMVLSLYYPYENRGSFVKIMAEGECVFGIYNKMTVDMSECKQAVHITTSRCNIIITEQQHMWNLRFDGPGIGWNVEGSISRAIDIISLQGSSNDSLSYYIDCHNECFRFERAIVKHNKYVEYSFFGCKIAPAREINTTLKFVHDGETTYLGGYWSTFTPSDQCFLVFLRFEYKPGDYHDLYAFIAPDFKPHLVAKYVVVTNPNVLFDFRETSNIYWSLCTPMNVTGPLWSVLSPSKGRGYVEQQQQQQQQQQQPMNYTESVSTGVSMLYVYITVPAMVLLILISAVMTLLLCKTLRDGRSQSRKTGTANPDQVQAVRPIQEQNRDRSNNDPDKFVTHPRDDDYDNPHGVIRPNSEHHYEEIPIVIYDDVMNRGNRDRRREHH